MQLLKDYVTWRVAPWGERSEKDKLTRSYLDYTTDAIVATLLVLTQPVPARRGHPAVEDYLACSVLKPAFSIVFWISAWVTCLSS